MADDIVGRDAELAAVQAFVERGAVPVALVVEGEPGIGKSTLWRAGVEHARSRGLRVLVSRPTEAERELAHVGLGDLLDEVAEQVLPVLAAPRRRALEAALLAGEERSLERVDPRALGLAIRNGLELLSAQQPLVVAIDDLHWFDPSSARALAFALRRSEGANIRLLLARRPGAATAVEQALPAVERLHVGPLSLGALHVVLQTQLGRTQPRPTLLRVHEASGGNPFYALELVRALDAEGAGTDPTRPLPVPESFDRLVHGRFDGLPDATREALALVAAAGRPSPTLLRSAGVPDVDLEPALAARIVEHAAGAIRFSHPLLASAFYQGLPGELRRRAHRILAEVVGEPLARARHLALSAAAPDAVTAAALDAAADVAHAAGAAIAAAELAEHAVRLTPADRPESRNGRTLAAARLQLTAGDTGRARVLAEELLAAAATEPLRADALVLLSDVEDAAGAVEQAIELRREALRTTADWPRLQASIHCWLALAVRERTGLAAGERHAHASLELAEAVGDASLRADALAVLALLRFNVGHPDALALAERACEPGLGGARLETSLCLAHVLTWSGDLDRARTLLERLERGLADRDELAAAEAAWYLSLVELAAGRLDAAAAHADRQREVRRQYGGDEREDHLALWPVARIAAHRGELALAHELATRGVALTQNLPASLSGQEAVLGLVAAWSGAPQEAVQHFEIAERERRRGLIAEPAMYWWRAEYAEALLELDRVDDAESVLFPWEADARRLGRATVVAQVTRCRGLVAAARGEIDRAVTLLERAAGEHEAADDPLGHARACLALGIVRRRARAKRPAREAIEAALAGFEAAGAAGWAATARRELGRIGGRTRTDGLTAAELRVATLVAEGRTNREVAAALFLGERTVASHLTHIYAKVGVRSRTELARKVQTF
jgi:DNA-binding CsgD family transcriptional regulator